MPSFIVAILNILGLVATQMPVIEKLLAGFGTFIANEANKLFGSSAGAEVNSGVNFVEGIIQDFDTAATDFEAEFVTLWPDIQSLITEFSFLPKMLMAHQLVQKANPKASPSYVINLIQAGHANVRVAAGQAAQAKKP